ncbi:hypothetical protein ACXHMN_02360 [Rhizobium sp. LEGMi12c]
MDKPLKLYRLVPIAAADDPNWLDAKSHGEVLVAARTARDAPIVATERELDFMDIDATPAQDKTTRMASAFRNEKLYTVIEVNNGREYRERGVVDDNQHQTDDNIKPVCIHTHDIAQVRHDVLPRRVTTGIFQLRNIADGVSFHPRWERSRKAR